MGYKGVVYTEPNIILLWNNMGYMGDDLYGVYQPKLNSNSNLSKNQQFL